MIQPGQVADQNYIAVTPDMFDRLVANDAEKLRWVREAVEQLRYYRGNRGGNSGASSDETGRTDH